jgi:hypothetical protein
MNPDRQAKNKNVTCKSRSRINISRNNIVIPKSIIAEVSCFYKGLQIADFDSFPL